MEVIEAILTRRSIRRYTEEPIGEEEMEQLIKAGMAAPSAHNEQPWHFIVIRDRALLEEIPKIHPYAQMLREAAAALAVCGDLEREKNKGLGYWILDCSAAAENILLAAHALGLGACWLGFHPRPERKDALRKLLKLPANVEPLCVIALGHPAEGKGPADRFKADRIHYNVW
ncbi:MAG: NADH dehydrogenase [Phycisphaerae bacterium SM23_30]|nr:MAG: NADH dehydrogenase [Phycisphaerae bacterium SM23_30]